MPLGALALVACGNEGLVQAVQQDVVRGFLDPQGAQFSETKVVSGEEIRYVCGLVNGRNAFGGYVGPRTYWGSDLADGLVSSRIVEDGSETPCEAFERTNSPEAADEAAQIYEKREFDRLNRQLSCSTGGLCLDEHGLDNSL